MRDVVVIVDLQFGSTGKGQIAGTLGRLWGVDTAVCANGPNAGHTYTWVDGFSDADGPIHNRVIHTVLPVAAVLPTVRNILLGPGAVIDIERLATEIRRAGDMGLLSQKRLIIHPNAAIVSQRHRDAEKPLVAIGSTMKGTAEAVIEKMRRNDFSAPIAKFHSVSIHELLERDCAAAHLDYVISYAEYDLAIDSSEKLLVEGAQGHSLSMHSQFYPHCTSRDVSGSQLWADCRLPLDKKARVHTLGVCRTFPIRVANRLNAQGQQVGYSGDCYDDQKELDWPQIEREPELTTVTKLPRRVFTFSTKQIIEAVRFNAPTSIALTFCDYLCKEIERPGGVGEGFNAPVASLIRRIEAAADCPVSLLGYGPLDRDLYSRSGLADPLLLNLRLPWEN